MRAKQFAAIVVVGFASVVSASEGRAQRPYDDAAWREPDFARRHATPYTGRDDRGYGGRQSSGFAGGYGGQHGRKQGGKQDASRRHPQGSYNDGWFQRPYPYHLDYYRMKYNGSYEPYFGNLYGPPINVFPGRGFYGGEFFY